MHFFTGWFSKIPGKFFLPGFLFFNLFISNANVKAQSANDLSALLIASPQQNSCGDSIGRIKIVVENKGTAAQSNFTVTAKVGTQTFTGTYTGSLAASAKDTVTMTGLFNSQIGGTYNFVAYTNLGTDQDKSNDTVKATIKILRTPNAPRPQTNVNGCQGVPSVLTAAKDTATVLSWFSSATATNSLFTGDNFVTPPVTANTTYYVNSRVGKSNMITSTFAAGNGQQGAMFNIRTIKQITVDSLDISMDGTGTDTVEIYYKPGTFEGSELNSSAWTFLGKRQVTGRNSGNPVRVPIGGLTIPQGQVYGIHVRLVLSTAIRYTDGTNSSTDTIRNSDLELQFGKGISGYFGGTFSPRIWNGNIYYTATENCPSKKVPINITVNPKPKADFAISNNCDRTNVTFTNSSSISGGTISYLWRFGDGNTSTDENPKHHYTNTGSYSVRLIVTSDQGCKDSMSKTFSVYPTPQARFGFAGGACPGQTVTFLDSSSVAVGGISRLWRFGDGNTSGAQNPQHKYSAPGTYDVKLIITTLGGCKDSVTKQFTVYPAPVMGFSATEVCQGELTRFTNTSTLASGFFSSVNWHFGDGNTSTQVSPTHTYAAQGTYKVKLVLVTVMGCRDSLTQNVVVRSNPVANFLATNVCRGEEVSFTNRTSVFPADSLTYKWEFGDGNTSTDKEPKHKYANPGNYTVKLTALSASGCSGVLSKQVSVYYLPIVKIGANPGRCKNTAVSFIDSTVIYSGNIASRAWNFGDGKTSTSANPQHVYTAAGTYRVRLIVTSNNGCVDSSSRQITIHETPLPAFTASETCLGTATTFTNTSTATSYTWNFGDGNTSTAQSPTHTYTSAGTYKTTLVARSAGGCLDSISNTVTVHALPSAGWSLTKGTGREITFTAKEGNHTAYLWNFGDGNTSTDKNPKHTYLKDSTYKVSLSVTNSNNCKQSHDSTFTLQTVGINSAPQMPAMKVEIAPNPFTAQTQIAYQLEKSARVKISVYDMSGKEVTVIADQKQTQGKYTFVLDAETHKMNAGIYLLRILVDDALITKQMIRLK